ncbi:hypothetical protein GCM10022254_00260 [Actinomadura meridiana]|uniref:Lipoprotein n=1 Tax=Actinomadura meridiana TaxID=559626 RepID=A0ABP8BR61_9ACTN
MRGIQNKPVALATVIAVAVLAGCSSQSAKEKWVSSTNEKCKSLTKRFTDDLAWGDSIGKDDLDRMKKRIKQIKDLQKHAHKDPPPEVNRRDLDGWLAKLGAYANSTQEMWRYFSAARSYMNLDLVLAMSTGLVKTAAEETKPLAQRLGLHKCMQVDRWEKLE